MNLIERIDSHNRKLCLKIVLRAFLAVFGYSAAYFFFYLVVVLLPATQPWMRGVAGLTGCLIVTVSTLLRERRRDEEGGMDSFVATRLAENTTGAVVVNHYAGRVTGSAVVLSGLFEAGPKSLLRIRELLGSFVSKEPAFLSKVKVLAGKIHEKRKWHSIDPYLDQLEEISTLALLGLIDLDFIKGRIKTTQTK